VRQSQNHPDSNQSYAKPHVGHLPSIARDKGGNRGTERSDERNDAGAPGDEFPHPHKQKLGCIACQSVNDIRGVKCSEVRDNERADAK
jgi:hypothetical protein